MNKKVLVINSPSYFKAVETLGKFDDNISNFLKSPEEYSFVLFPGGADISPKLYNDESPFKVCGPSDDYKDFTEVTVFKTALKNNIKMVGICRGIQFLTAMAGGKLLHHIDNHAGVYHNMFLHQPWNGKNVIQINSLHHQMCIPPRKSRLLGWASKGIANGYYIGNFDKEVNWKGPDVEALYLQNINAFGVQWHPEMMSPDSDGYKWFNYAVNLFLYHEELFFENILGEPKNIKQLTTGK